jgi:hypothetical protein
MIELGMPGLNDVFSCGTEGYYLMIEILAAAFDHWNTLDPAPGAAMNFLDEALPDRSRDQNPQ